MTHSFYCRGGDDEPFGTVLVLQVRSKIRRVKTIYDCEADNEDELAFAEGEVIIVTGEEDQEWWVGTSCLQLSQKTQICFNFNGLTLVRVVHILKKDKSKVH